MLGHLEVGDSVRQVIGDDKEVLLSHQFGVGRLIFGVFLLFNILKVPVSELDDILAFLLALDLVQSTQLSLLVPAVVEQFLYRHEPAGVEMV